MHFNRVIFLAVLFASCHQQAVKQTAPSNHLEAAVEWLELDGRDGAYAILEDPENKNYLQFGLMLEKWLNVDVPVYADGKQNFEIKHPWTIVEKLPSIDPSSRREFITPKAAGQLWNYLREQGLEPYYYRSQYEDEGKVIAVTESICCNFFRHDRESFVRIAGKIFEISHGYPLPKILNMTTNQTSWWHPKSKEDGRADDDKAGSRSGVGAN